MTSSLSQAARAKFANDYLAERRARSPKLVPPRTFVNATTVGAYTGNNMHCARAGADHQHISLGLGPQLRIAPPRLKPPEVLG